MLFYLITNNLGLCPVYEPRPWKYTKEPEVILLCSLFFNLTPVVFLWYSGWNDRLLLLLLTVALNPPPLTYPDKIPILSWYLCLMLPPVWLNISSSFVLIRSTHWGVEGISRYDDKNPAKGCTTSNYFTKLSLVTYPWGSTHVKKQRWILGYCITLSYLSKEVVKIIRY